MWDSETGSLVGKPLERHYWPCTSSSDVDTSSPPDLVTRRFGSRVLRLVLQSVSLYKGTPTMYSPLLIHPMGSTSFPDP